MGAAQSTRQNYNSMNVPETNYSEHDIKGRIDQLFLKNRSNRFTESSMAATINGVGNLDTYMNTEQLGGKNIKNSNIVPHINVVPRRHRYDNYEVENFIKSLGQQRQQGGQAAARAAQAVEGQFEQLSELSEFDRIRDYLKNDVAQHSNAGQLGGSAALNRQMQPFSLTGGNPLNVESELHMESPPSDGSCGCGGDGDGKLSLLEALRGGASRTPDDDSWDMDDANDEDSSEAVDDDIVESNTPVNSYSETSFSSKSSEINILPFYSTSSSSNNSFKHPYVKNRFN